MRRLFVQLFVGVVLTLAYTLLFFYGTRLANTVGAPPWWVRLFPSSLAGVFTWFTLERILAIAVIALPVGVVIALVYPQRRIFVAVVMGAIAFLIGQMQLVSQIANTDTLIKTTLFLDLLAMSTAPALMASIAMRLPSNHRWRGP